MSAVAGFVLVPYGSSFLRLTLDEFATAMARGLAPGPIVAPSQDGVAGQPERLVTSQQLADLLGVGDTTLEAMAARGVIPSIRVGKALRFVPSEVLTALRSAAPRHADSRSSAL